VDDFKNKVLLHKEQGWDHVWGWEVKGPEGANNLVDLWCMEVLMQTTHGRGYPHCDFNGGRFAMPTRHLSPVVTCRHLA